MRTRKKVVREEKKIEPRSERTILTAMNMICAQMQLSELKDLVQSFEHRRYTNSYLDKNLMLCAFESAKVLRERTGVDS